LTGAIQYTPKAAVLGAECAAEVERIDRRVAGQARRAAAVSRYHTVPTDRLDADDPQPVPLLDRRGVGSEAEAGAVQAERQVGQNPASVVVVEAEVAAVDEIVHAVSNRKQVSENATAGRRRSRPVRTRRPFSVDARLPGGALAPDTLVVQ